MNTTNGKILWVDDEIDFLQMHILFLKQKGYELTTCTNGADAIEATKQQEFDLILLDENMPGLAGLETLTALKKHKPHIPVVMVTKSEAEDLMDQAIGAMIADYLLKPVNPKQILLTLKKNIHRQELVAEATQSGYRQEFAQIAAQIEQAQSADDWTDLYKQLVQWELALAASADDTMADMLRMQKEEANRAFAKFVQKNYESWIAQAPSRPLLSPDLFKQAIFPRLNAGKKVVFLLLDNLRFDQWCVLRDELTSLFEIDEKIYFSILPTATQYARNAIFAGMMPADIRTHYPSLWVDEEEDEGKNLNEETLIREQLARFRRKEAFSYHKINGATQADKLLPQLKQWANKPLNVLVINFIDMLSHARTESMMLRELAGTEAAYRDITLSWFRHSSIKALFASLATLDADLIISTDHGSIRCDNPVKVVGERQISTNLRYKQGRKLGYNSKDVFEVKDPSRIGLPAQNLSSSFIFARPGDFFAYPNNYNHYVQYYRNTFQHGGISMEEMMIPLIALTPKR